MEKILNEPSFGIVITILAFWIAKSFYNKFKISLFNPILVSSVIIISFLMIFNIKLESYLKGGSMIEFFLKPSTVVLAIPLYNQIKYLKKYYKAILSGIFVGSVTAVVSVFVLGKLLNLNMDVIKSILPKSVTTPIGIEISYSIDAIVSITVFVIVISGIIGAIFAPIVCSIFKINNSVARGVAIGTASHAVGTSKAIEMGEVEGAMSGLSIGITGLATTFIIPLFLFILSLFS
jgi:predicted murein hydrolase (TIGR00659 family)